MIQSQQEVFRLSNEAVAELVADVIEQIGRCLGRCLRKYHVRCFTPGGLYQCSEAVGFDTRVILITPARYPRHARQLRARLIQ